MKKVIAFILLLIFSLQILPVREVSNFIFKKQLIEDANSSYSKNMNDDSEVKLKKDSNYFQFYATSNQNHSRVSFLSHEINTALHVAERLPSNFVPEILTPPPNFSC